MHVLRILVVVLTSLNFSVLGFFPYSLVFDMCHFLRKDVIGVFVSSGCFLNGRIFLMLLLKIVYLCVTKC